MSTEGITSYKGSELGWRRSVFLWSLIYKSPNNFILMIHTIINCALACCYFFPYTGGFKLGTRRRDCKNWQEYYSFFQRFFISYIKINQECYFRNLLSHYLPLENLCTSGIVKRNNYLRARKNLRREAAKFEVSSAYCFKRSN